MTCEIGLQLSESWRPAMQVMLEADGWQMFVVMMCVLALKMET